MDNKENKKYEDCILELVNLASTPFEKKAVIELATMESRYNEILAKIRVELKWIKYLTVVIFVAVVIERVILR